MNRHPPLPTPPVRLLLPRHSRCRADLNDIGSVLWFEALPQWVFLRPEWIMGAMAFIVAESHAGKDLLSRAIHLASDRHSALEQLHRTAVLHESLIPLLWQQLLHDSGGMSPAELCDLLVHFGILIRVPSGEQAALPREPPGRRQEQQAHEGGAGQGESKYGGMPAQQAAALLKPSPAKRWLVPCLLKTEGPGQ